MFAPVRLSTFSGDGSAKDISYRQWKLEVRGLELEGYSSRTIFGCIRRTVRGSAADLLIPMGNDVTVADIMSRFDMVFGEVQSTEAVLREFYRASQTRVETVAVWACRLEDMLSRVSGPYVESKKEMLRSRFFNGISDTSVQAAIRHHYDNGASFEALLVAARKAEAEKSVPIVPKSQQVVDKDSQDRCKKIDSMLTEMNSLKNRLHRMENQMNRQTYVQSPPSNPRTVHNANSGYRGQQRSVPRCFKCNQMGHKSYDCKALNGNQS